MTVPSVVNKRFRGAIRRFNPGTLQSDAEIIEQFVVRQHELDTVLGSLRGNVDSPSCEHVLVIAPRGSGKTMLFARTAAELRTNEEYSQSLLPVRFMEESLEIFNLADFWLETLFHLATEIAATHPTLARELRDTQRDLSARWREQLLHYHARLAVLDAADRLGRRLVLMIENLQSLTRTVDQDFGWQLRATLQCEPQIMLLASSTTRFEALDDAAEPFFEQFRIVSLGPLETGDCRRLWQAVTGDLVPERRIRPLEILTGGNPRLLVIVAGIAGHRSLRRLMEELVALIDEHTEYFRGHLDALPRSERRVYAAVLDLWEPSNTGEIAARARMNVRVASTMLARLARRGALLVDATTGPRKRLYAAAEPLCSIYYKLRRERDEAAVVERLIRFMVAFYDPSVVFQVFDRLPSEASDSAAMHAGINRALATRPRDDFSSQEKWDRLEDASSRITDYRRTEARRRLREDTGAALRDGAWERVLELVQQYVNAGWTRTTGVEGEHDFAQLTHLKADAYLGMAEYGKVLELGSQMLERYRDSRDQFLLHKTALVLIAKGTAHFKLRDFRQVIAGTRELVDRFEEFDVPDLQQVVADALIMQARAETELNDFEAAHLLLNDVVRRFDKVDHPEVQQWVVRALVEKVENAPNTDDHDEYVIEYCNQVIARIDKVELADVSDSVAMAFLSRGIAQGDLGDFEGEIASYQEMIDLFDGEDSADTEDGVAVALASMGLRQAEIGRGDDALSACDELERRLAALPGKSRWKRWLAWRATCVRAMALMARKETKLALDVFRSACRAFLSDGTPLDHWIVRTVLNLIALGAPEQDLLDALARQQDSTHPCATDYCATPAHGRSCPRARGSTWGRRRLPQANRRNRRQGHCDGLTCASTHCQTGAASL